MIGKMAGPWMERVRRAGLGVVSWNVNEATLLDQLRQIGVDAICTDDPRVVPWLTARQEGR